MSDNSSEVDVEAIRARLDAATPGPWSRFGREIGNEDGDSWYLGHDIEGPPEAERGQFERVADAELIANAPTDLRRLLDENARLTAAYVTLSDIARGNLDQVNELRAELAAARSECAALTAKAEAARALRSSWFQSAEVVRERAESIPGLTEVERAELRQGAIEMETCARQLGHELGPTTEERPDFTPGMPHTPAEEAR